MINKTIIDLTNENKELKDKLRRIKTLAHEENWGGTAINILQIAEIVREVE